MILLLLPMLCCVMLAVMCVCFLVIRGRSGLQVPPHRSGDQVVAPVSNDAGFRTTGITFFGQSQADDNGVGFAGVDLFKHGTAGLQFNGQPLYPAAVFQGDAAGMLWSVLEVRSDQFPKNKTVYVHVVDVCNSGQDVCKRNTAKYGYLVDIHNTAKDYIGVNDGLLRGQFRKVGDLRPSKITGNIWLKGDDYIACSCTGKCAGDDVKWTKRSACS